MTAGIFAQTPLVPLDSVGIPMARWEKPEQGHSVSRPKMSSVLYFQDHPKMLIYLYNRSMHMLLDAEKKGDAGLYYHFRLKNLDSLVTLDNGVVTVDTMQFNRTGRPEYIINWTFRTADIYSMDTKLSGVMIWDIDSFICMLDVYTESIASYSGTVYLPVNGGELPRFYCRSHNTFGFHNSLVSGSHYTEESSNPPTAQAQKVYHCPLPAIPFELYGYYAWINNEWRMVRNHRLEKK